MSRRAIWIDRLLILLLGLALATAGAGAAGWQDGRLPDAPQRLTLPWLEKALDAGWWPAALAGVGLLLLLIGLRWLAAHAPYRRVHDVTMSGSDDTGRLQVDLSSVATAAADAVVGLGVQSCTGRAIRDRGRRIVELEVRLEPGASLASASAAVSDAVAQLALTELDIATRVRVRVARSASRRAAARVV